jgi:hypothetical protein
MSSDAPLRIGETLASVHADASKGVTDRSRAGT